MEEKISKGGSPQLALGALLPLPRTPGQNDHLLLSHNACQVTVYIGKDPEVRKMNSNNSWAPPCPCLRCIPAALTQGRSVWSTGTIPSHLPTKESSSFHSPLTHSPSREPYGWNNNNIFIKPSPEKPKSERQNSQLFFFKWQSSPRGKNSWAKLNSWSPKKVSPGCQVCGFILLLLFCTMRSFYKPPCNWEAQKIPCVILDLTCKWFHGLLEVIFTNYHLGRRGLFACCLQNAQGEECMLLLKQT